MFIRINYNSGEPVYLQIINQIKKEIALGKLRQNDKLPSVRDLSKELLINPNTILKAYNILETENIVFTKQGLGTFINASESKLKISEKNRIIEELAETMIINARNLNITKDKLYKIIDAQIKKFNLE